MTFMPAANCRTAAAKTGDNLMKFWIALAAMSLPAAAALAQPTNPMQQLVDQKTADVTTTIGVFRNQIMSDQTQINADQARIEALTHENADLKKRLSDHEKKPEPPAGGPQVGHP